MNNLKNCCLIVLIILNLIFIKNAYSHSADDVCSSEQCKRTAEMFKRNMDITMDPCHNFYEFACGNFKNHAVIKPGNQIVQEITKRADELDNKLLGYLKRNDYFSNAAIKKIQRFFQLCIDEDAIEAAGDIAIPSYLAKIGLPVQPPFNRLANKSNNYGQILARIHRYAAVQFLFTTDVFSDIQNNTINRVFIGKTTSTKSFFMDSQHTATNFNQLFYPLRFADGQNNKKNEENGTVSVFEKNYKEYIMGVVEYFYKLTYTKISKMTLQLTSDRVDKVFKFFLRAHLILNNKKYNEDVFESITVHELQVKTDRILQKSTIKFSWLDYLVTLFENIYDVEKYFVSGEPLVVTNMEFLENIFELISVTEEEVFEASFWWETVKEIINISNKETRTLHRKFWESVLVTGVFPSREDTCLSIVKKRFNRALIHMLLQEANVERDKDKVAEMTENIKSSFQETIKNAPWLDASTKMAALNKLDYMIAFISHESWLKSSEIIEKIYVGLEIVYDSWYGTITKCQTRDVTDRLVLLFIENKPNTNSFRGPLIDPLEIDAAYSFHRNVIDIPYGVFGPPYTNLGLQCLDYSGIGYVIGHELVHGFDNKGKNFDSFGNESYWWKETTDEDFNKRAECFVASYNKFYFDEVQMHVNGELTLGENIADCGGIKQALRAYEKYVAKYGPEKKLIGFEEYTSEQLFTLGMANLWCSSSTPESLKYTIQNDEHAPHPARINGMFMNTERMSEIWGCEVGAAMNPQDKCRIW